ncbi:hypothetical protein ES708_31461 [subsurface metagenome]
MVGIRPLCRFYDSGMDWGLADRLHGSPLGRGTYAYRHGRHWPGPVCQPAHPEAQKRPTNLWLSQSRDHRRHDKWHFPHPAMRLHSAGSLAPDWNPPAYIRRADPGHCQCGFAGQPCQRLDCPSWPGREPEHGGSFSAYDGRCPGIDRRYGGRYRYITDGMDTGRHLGIGVDCRSDPLGKLAAAHEIHRYPDGRDTR